MDVQKVDQGTKEILLDFLKNTDDFLIIDGGAGSGKTTSIAWALNYCDENNLSTNAVSYTGKAASMLRDKTSGKYGQTIHLFLYSYDYDVDDELIEEGQPKRNRKINESPVDVLFVDESSMLSKKVSGFEVNEKPTYLLDELVNLQCKKNSKKIVFVGDHRQLAPVEKEDHHDSEISEASTSFGEAEEFKSTSSIFTDALNENVLIDHYDLRGSAYYCSENYRNNDDSKIKSISFKLQKEITIDENIDYSPSEWIKEHFPELIFRTKEEAFLWLTEKRNKVGWVDTRVVSGFNASVDELNSDIRTKVEGMTGEIGENKFKSTHPLMNLRNRHESEIYNGDTFFIEETTDENFYTTNKVSNCQKSSRTHSQCKKGTLEQLKLSKVKVNLKRSSEASKEVLIMNELIKLEIARKDLDDRYNKNLWLDFAHRNPELEKEKDYDWYQGLRQDQVTNTLLAVHAFTSTVHKAQGDEFKYVLVDLDNEQFSLKWLYTAVTRAISEVRFLIS